MPLRCPECESNALRVDSSIELGSDARSDEVALQVVKCGTCGMRAVAVYEQSRRGALDDESVNHLAYPADSHALEEIEGIITSCRRPEDPDCGCRGHQRARAIVRDQIDPEGVDWDAPMPVYFVRG